MLQGGETSLQQYPEEAIPLVIFNEEKKLKRLLFLILVNLYFIIMQFLS